MKNDYDIMQDLFGLLVMVDCSVGGGIQNGQNIDRLIFRDGPILNSLYSLVDSMKSIL